MILTLEMLPSIDEDLAGSDLIVFPFDFMEKYGLFLGVNILLQTPDPKKGECLLTVGWCEKDGYNPQKIYVGPECHDRLVELFSLLEDGDRGLLITKTEKESFEQPTTLLIQNKDKDDVLLLLDRVRKWIKEKERVNFGIPYQWEEGNHLIFLDNIDKKPAWGRPDLSNPHFAIIYITDWHNWRTEWEKYKRLQNKTEKGIRQLEETYKRCNDLSGKVLNTKNEIETIGIKRVEFLIACLKTMRCIEGAVFDDQENLVQSIQSHSKQWQRLKDNDSIMVQGEEIRSNQRLSEIKKEYVKPVSYESNILEKGEKITLAEENELNPIKEKINIFDCDFLSLSRPPLKYPDDHCDIMEDLNARLEEYQANIKNELDYIEEQLRKLRIENNELIEKKSKLDNLIEQIQKKLADSFQSLNEYIIGLLQECNNEGPWIDWLTGMDRRLKGIQDLYGSLKTKKVFLYEDVNDLKKKGHELVNMILRFKEITADKPDLFDFTVEARNVRPSIYI